MKRFFTWALAAAVSLSGFAEVLFVGHRGSDIGLENSVESFTNGAKRGYKYLETDWKLTKDKQFVCSHDDDTKRLGGTLTLASSTLAELQAETLKQTRSGVVYTGRLCSAAEYLEVCRQHDVLPLIELKWTDGINNNDCSNIPLLINFIESQGFRDKCIILTSMKPCLEYIRKNYPDIKLQFLTGQYWANHFDWCVAQGIDVDIQTGYFDKATVKKYHDAGLEVNIWTANSSGDYKLYASWGVDYITTDKLDPASLPSIDPDPEPDPDAEDVDIRIERLWLNSLSTSNAPGNIDGSNAQQGTAVDGLFYVNNCAEKLIHIFDRSGWLGSIPGGAGWGCCRDDAGNIIVRDDKLTATSHSFIVYPAGATVENPGTPVRIEAEVPLSGQTNFINASGDVLGEGGYIYLFSNKQTAASIISVKNGVYQSAKASQTLNMTATTAGYIVPIDNNPDFFFYNVRGIGIEQYRNGATSDISTVRASTTAPARNSTGGCARMVLRGNVLLAHNSGSNYLGGFTLRNLSKDTVIETYTPIGNMGYVTGGNYSTFNWLIPERINDDSYYLYQYCPANGMGLYRVYIEDQGVDNIAADDADTDAPIEYYNLQGVRVANPEAGLYIRRQGSRATKVLLP